MAIIALLIFQQELITAHQLQLITYSLTYIKIPSASQHTSDVFARGKTALF